MGLDEGLVLLDLVWTPCPPFLPLFFLPPLPSYPLILLHTSPLFLLSSYRPFLSPSSHLFLVLPPLLILSLPLSLSTPCSYLWAVHPHFFRDVGPVRVHSLAERAVGIFRSLFLGGRQRVIEEKMEGAGRGRRGEER